MASVFRPSNIEDQPRIVELLTRVFESASFLNPELMRWRYWEPRRDITGPQSVVLEKNGQIVAHAGLWPIDVITGTERERGVQMIDWVSAPESPGAGVSLLQQLTKAYDFVYSIGGSPSTQAILPKFGFHTVDTASTFARPLRPFRQLLHHQTRDYRMPIRLARNFWWSKMPTMAPPVNWTVSPADEAKVTCERTPEFFEYLKKCPAMQFLGFDLIDGNSVAGFLALSVVGHQARIAGVYLQEPALESWRAAFLLAQRAALRHTPALEVTARVAGQEATAAAAQAGLRFRKKADVYLFRKLKAAKPLPLHYQLADDDSVFLSEGRTEFLT